MIYPVKVFDKEGNLKRIISKEELEEGFWNPTHLKSKGNRNSHFFALKDRHSSEELDRKLSHGTFHPKIP
jgi:hypothetical protein